MQENTNNTEQSVKDNHKIEVDKSFQYEEKSKPQKSGFLGKLQDKIKNINTPHHIKLDTIFDTVKNAHTILAMEKKTYDFVINMNKLLIAIIAIQLILIMSLFPLKEKEPYLVGFSNATQNFVHIEKANETITANEALIRNLIGSYIINRETINQFDEKERFEIIRMQSNFKTWKIFENIVAQEQSIYGNSNITREVKIVNIAKFKDGYANAEVAITLYSLGMIQSQKRYRITMTYKFNTLDIDFESLPKNPTGFEVQEYAVTEIATIKELDDENKVDYKNSKSRIKSNSNVKTDSNEFLREAYQFKESPKPAQKQPAQQKQQELMNPQDYSKLSDLEKARQMNKELEMLKEENKAKDQIKAFNPFDE